MQQPFFCVCPEERTSQASDQQLGLGANVRSVLQLCTCYPCLGCTPSLLLPWLYTCSRRKAASSRPTCSCVMLSIKQGALPSDSLPSLSCLLLAVLHCVPVPSKAIILHHDHMAGQCTALGEDL